MYACCVCYSVSGIDRDPHCVLHSWLPSTGLVGDLLPKTSCQIGAGAGEETGRVRRPVDVCSYIDYNTKCNHPDAEFEEHFRLITVN
jgi:hypothetical protein